ncbi:sigma-70 family RNA polymerase sigma factor [Virgibacillus ainsalahensis]
MEENKRPFTFEEIMEQNERRIHFHINRLHIRDDNQEFYREGLFALWNAYESYQPDKGPMATYFNYIIRNRLIDLIRKENRTNEIKDQFIQENKVEYTDGNHIRGTEGTTPIPGQTDILLEDTALWQQLKTALTQNQWKWVYYHIIDGIPLKEIAIQENTTMEAVKSWGKQVRKKLRDEKFRERINWAPPVNM